VEDWAEIRWLHKAEGLGIRAIARRVGVARNTVREAWRSDAPPPLRAGGVRFDRRCGGAGHAPNQRPDENSSLRRIQPAIPAQFSTGVDSPVPPPRPAPGYGPGASVRDAIIFRESQIPAVVGTGKVTAR
jgi:hypothetical protein